MNSVIKKQIMQVIEDHKKNVSELEAKGIGPLAAAAEKITEVLKKGGRIYICGNGGSAADAQHIAAELVGKFTRQRQALPAVALTTNTSVITSISNDYNYESIFVRQVEALVNKGDILWAISTSGTSPNVIAAAELAKKKKACVIAFTGRKNTKLERIADICFCANEKSTARSQEAHQLGYHIICDLVERSFTDN